MNKKVNTALFIIGATVFNIVLMLVCFLLAIAASGLCSLQRPLLRLRRSSCCWLFSSPSV